MKLSAAVVAVLQLAVASAASSQTFDHLRIDVEGWYTPGDRAERRSVGFSNQPIVIGETESSLFSMAECSPFSVSAGHLPFAPNAKTAWRVDVTPTRVTEDAVTFRLRWSRVLHDGKPSIAPGDDIEVTLRPGESRPIDSVTVPRGATRADGDSCAISAASMRVAVDYHPRAEVDRRLVVTDLWLIERSPGGNERSQHVSVRGVPNRPAAFFFDSLVENAVAVDIFGEVAARVGSGPMRVSIQTRSRSATAAGERDPNALVPARAVESVIHLKTDETVEIGLPKLGPSAGALANRDLAIRVRARQVR